MDNIPLATAYPWAPGERPYGILPRKRKQMGSGFAALQKGLHGTGAGAQSILLRLLNDAGVDLDRDQPSIVQRLSFMSKRPKQVVTSSSSSKEEQLVRDAQNGKCSLLGSILNVVHEAEPVSAKHILRTCALIVRPGDVPAPMDAKEMVLAAIHFLSCATTTTTTTATSTTSDRHAKQLLPPLPLIRPLQENPDLEKRIYEKVGTWILSSDFVKSDAFQNLEALFCSSALPWEWLGRERFCPRLAPPILPTSSSTTTTTTTTTASIIADDEEALLLLKGTIPARAMPAKVSRKGEGGGPRKRKSTAAVAAAAAVSATNSSALSVASNASGELELEATLVMDDDDDSVHGNLIPSSHPLF